MMLIYLAQQWGADTVAAMIVGIMIVATGGLGTYLFVRFMIWWWDQNK